MQITKIIALSLCSVILLGGCAKDIGSDIYTESNFGEASHTYQGIILNARKVTMQQGDKLEDNKTGIAAGAITGMVVGNQFGKGSGNVATTVLGGVGGAFLGSIAEKKLKTQDAMEYIVKITDGKKAGDTRTVVQGMNPIFSVNQKVFIMISKEGNRSRIIPDNS